MLDRRPLLFVAFLLISQMASSPDVDAVVSQPLVIDSDSDFVAKGYPGSGTKSDPYLIDSLTIDSKGQMSNGIEVTNTHAYFVITRCEIKADYIGILLEEVAPGTATLKNNHLTGNMGNGGGIVLGSDGVRVTSNTCTGFAEGIHTNYSDDCVIAGNVLGNNSYHGLSLRYSNRNTVANNTIKGNGAHGIFIIRDSSGNVVYNNTLVDNASIESYEWDDIYHFEVKSQALDVGTANTWYSETRKLGNCWSDYGASGPYKIDGSANAIDMYPRKVGESPPKEEKSPEIPNQGIPGYYPSAVIIGIFLALFFIYLKRSWFKTGSKTEENRVEVRIRLFRFPF